MSVVEGARDVEGGGERDEHVGAVRAEGEVVEGGGGDLEAGGGGADVGEGVLQQIHLQIRLFLQCPQLLHAHPLHTYPSLRRRHFRFSLKSSLLLSSLQLPLTLTLALALTNPQTPFVPKCICKERIVLT